MIDRIDLLGGIHGPVHRGRGARHGRGPLGNTPMTPNQAAAALRQQRLNEQAGTGRRASGSETPIIEVERIRDNPQVTGGKNRVRGEAPWGLNENGTRSRFPGPNRSINDTVYRELSPEQQLEVSQQWRQERADQIAAYKAEQEYLEWLNGGGTDPLQAGFGEITEFVSKYKYELLGLLALSVGVKIIKEKKEKAKQDELSKNQ